MNNDDRLIRAIQAGKPVPGTPEQAAELAGTRRANIVKCAECGEVGDRGYFGKNTANPIPLPICAKCKADADGAAEAQLRAAVAALNEAAKVTLARIDAAHDRNQEYMSDGREGRDSFDRYCNEGDDE